MASRVPRRAEIGRTPTVKPSALRPAPDPTEHGAGDPQQLWLLQRQAGNRAVRALLSGSATPDGLAVQRQSHPRDDGTENVLAEARALDRTLELTLSDLRDAGSDQAREIAPEQLEQWAGETHERLARCGRLLGRVNALYAHGQEAADLVSFVQAVQSFDQALAGTRRGSGTELREAGQAMAALGEAAASALNSIPLPPEALPVKVLIQTIIRTAAGIGNVGVRVFARHFDQLDQVGEEESARSPGRGVNAPGVDRAQVVSLRFHLGDAYINWTTETDVALRRLAVEADGLVADLREHVRGGMLPAWMPGSTPAELQGDEQQEALAILEGIGLDLHRTAEVVAADVVRRNEMLLMLRSARSAVENEGDRLAMLGQLTRRMSSDDHFIAGHLLARGTIPGVARPADIGYEGR